MEGNMGESLSALAAAIERGLVKSGTATESPAVVIARELVATGWVTADPTPSWRDHPVWNPK